MTKTDRRNSSSEKKNGRKKLEECKMHKEPAPMDPGGSPVTDRVIVVFDPVDNVLIFRLGDENKEGAGGATTVGDSRGADPTFSTDDDDDEEEEDDEEDNEYEDMPELLSYYEEELNLEFEGILRNLYRSMVCNPQDGSDWPTPSTGVSQYDEGGCRRRQYSHPRGKSRGDTSGCWE
jgi:hypothetical protein